MSEPSTTARPGRRPRRAAPGASPAAVAETRRPLPDDHDGRAQLVASVTLAHPSVEALHSGPFGSISSYLPGRRLSGVRLGGDGEPVELGVVLRLDRPIPAVVAELRAQITELWGPAAKPVDVTVADVVLPLAPTGGYPAGPE